MNRWLAALILLTWTIVATGSLWIVSSSGDFPTSVKALVSNLDAVHSDELIAAHFGVGQNETTLYCTTPGTAQRAAEVARKAGIVSLDEACSTTTGTTGATETIRAVSRGYLSSTPRTLLLEGIDLAQSVKKTDATSAQANANPAPRIKPRASDLRRAELWSLSLTVLALLLCLRSIPAALLTFAFGSAIVAVTWGILALMSVSITVPFVIVSIASLLALALGADLASQAYIARMTSGHIARTTALVACAGVATAFLPLVLFPPNGLRALSLGAFVASSVALVGAFTLLPAVFALVGDRAFKSLPRDHEGRGPVPFAIRVSRQRPALFAVLALALLAPLSMSGFQQLRSPQSVLPESVATTTTNVSNQFAGDVERMTKGTIEFVVDVPWSPSADTYLSSLVATIAAHPEFSAPIFVQWSSDNQIAVVTAFATESSSASALRSARAVVHAESSGAYERTFVGGPVMLGAQVDAILSAWSIWGAIGALIFAMVVLTIGFRAPVMVVIMMLGAGISSLAALGILARLVSGGISAGPFQIDAQSGLDPWAPLIVTCVVVATSTSYVSLVLGQQRESVHFENCSEAFARALSKAPQLTTAAAVSMIAIGLGFTTSGVSSLQQAGAGLAIALAIQATLVRAILTPASLELIGRRHWRFWRA
jgi:RND superfamily putative drug exporter